MAASQAFKASNISKYLLMDGIDGALVALFHFLLFCFFFVQKLSYLWLIKTQ
jgi:hypothetical protein